MLVLNASTPREIDVSLAKLRPRVGALVVVGGPFFVVRSQQIVALATRDGIPVAAAAHEFVAEGALMSYGNDTADGYRRAGLYVEDLYVRDASNREVFHFDSNSANLYIGTTDNEGDLIVRDASTHASNRYRYPISSHAS